LQLHVSMYVLELIETYGIQTVERLLAARCQQNHYRSWL